MHLKCRITLSINNHVCVLLIFMGNDYGLFRGGALCKHVEQNNISYIALLV